MKTMNAICRVVVVALAPTMEPASCVSVRVVVGPTAVADATSPSLMAFMENIHCPHVQMPPLLSLSQLCTGQKVDTLNLKEEGKY